MSPAPTNAFGVLLAQARGNRGLSVRRLARHVGVSHQYLSKLEAGRHHNPSSVLVARLLDALAVPSVLQGAYLRALIESAADGGASAAA